MEYVIGVVTMMVMITLLAPVTQCVTTDDTGAGISYKLEVTKDVTLRDPVKNYNNVYLEVSRNLKDNTNMRSLMAFENLPNTCQVIKSAKMYLYYLNVPRSAFQSISEAPFIPHRLVVHQVKRSWSDRAATSRRRFFGVIGLYRHDWQTEYLGLDGTDADPLPQALSVPIFPFRPAGWVEFDITKAVANWKGRFRNHGLLIWDLDESAGGREIAFASKEYTDDEKHPFVRVLCA